MNGSPNIQEIERARQSGDTSNGIPPGQEEVLCHKCFYACCQPRGFMHRFMAPFFMCSLSFSTFFCYDNPAALAGHFKTDLNITITEFSAINSVCAWPNVFLCFVGGYLIDRVFGVRLGMNIYVTITLFGQLIVASGVILNMYWMLLLGRFIFGISAESLAVVQNKYAVRSFKAKELNIMFGLQLSFAGIGSVVNFMVMESTYRWLNTYYDGYECLGLVLFIAASPCLLSTICVFGFMDSRAERIPSRNEARTTEVVNLKDVKKFRCTFWLVCIICVMYYVTMYPFISLGTGFFKEKFHLDDIAASRLDGFMYMISVFASPGFGYMIDLTGMKTVWILVALSGTVTAHAVLAFTSFSPYISMVLMGICYCVIASSLLPLLSLIIPECHLGTAYGVCQSVQNLGLAIAYILAGQIIDIFGYRWLEISFISCLMVAHIATLLLWVADKNQGSVLNMTSGDRKIHQENIRIAWNMQSEGLLIQNPLQAI